MGSQQDKERLFHCFFIYEGEVISSYKSRQDNVRNQHVMGSVQGKVQSGLPIATKEPGYYTLGKGGPSQVSLSDPHSNHSD